eukprot:14383372-Ditylum_brightwellii.AAC.2
MALAVEYLTGVSAKIGGLLLGNPVAGGNGGDPEGPGVPEGSLCIGPDGPPGGPPVPEGPVGPG